MIGFYRTFDLSDTYDPSDIDETLAHTGAAKTQIPAALDSVAAIPKDGRARPISRDQENGSSSGYF